MPSASPDSVQLLEALNLSGLRWEPFVDYLIRNGFDLAASKGGVTHFRRGAGKIALLPGPEGVIATCVYFPEPYYFSVATAIQMKSAISLDDEQLNSAGIVLVAAGVSRTGLSLPIELVRTLRANAKANAGHSVRDRVIEVVAGHFNIGGVDEGTQLEAFCDEMDMMDIISSLEDLYGISINGLDDWEPFESPSVSTVGDLIALVAPLVDGLSHPLVSSCAESESKSRMAWVAAVLGCGAAQKPPPPARHLLPVGTEVPALTRVDQRGQVVNLHAGAPTLLYFYPKDGTPDCTQEASPIHDTWDVYRLLKLRVIGVSADTDDEHRAFSNEHRLPFPLIADPEHAWSDAFGVGQFHGGLDERVSFLIDANNRIVKIYENFDPGVHAGEVLRDAEALGLKQ